MPGKHDPAKKYISFVITRKLWYELTQAAMMNGIDRSAFVTAIFESEMRRLGIKLTPENTAKMLEETETERRRRIASWSGYEERRAKIDKTIDAKNRKTETEKKGRR